MNARGPGTITLPPALTRLLAERPPVLVMSGAGLSAASGVATFRDAQTGMWARFRPEDLATPEAFERDPETVWAWYAWRREQVLAVRPNAAHRALTRWQAAADVTLLTQNVDGLQQRAGAREVIEFHGNLFENRCSAEMRRLEDRELEPGAPPRCRHCGARVRPGVVWFGEGIPARAMAAADEAVARCRLFVSVGTSSLVWPAAGFAEQALRNGARLVEINPAPTPLSGLADVRFEAGADDVLPVLVDAALGDENRIQSESV